MGSVLLGIVAHRRSDRTSLSHSNSNAESADSSEKSKNALLLETPPLGIRHQSKTKAEPTSWAQTAKIGKLTRIPDRKIRDEHQVIAKVSHTRNISYQSRNA